MFAGGTKGIRLMPASSRNRRRQGRHRPDTAERLLVHTEQGSSLYAHLLAQLVQPDFPMPMGVLYREDKPTYDAAREHQVQKRSRSRARAIYKLMYSGMTWEVGADGTRH